MVCVCPSLDSNLYNFPHNVETALNFVVHEVSRQSVHKCCISQIFNLLKYRSSYMKNDQI